MSLDTLTLFGLISVTAMLVFYAVEDWHPHFILAFAVSCLFASLYGFLQGAWPFDVLELIWSGIAYLRWRKRTIRSAGAGSV